MANHPCVAEVLEQMGGKATERQVKTWVTKLQNSGVPDDKIMSKAVIYGEEALRKAAHKKKQTALMLQKEMEMLEFLSDYKGDEVTGFRAFMAGIQSDKAGSRNSVYLHQENLERKYINGLMTSLQRADLFDDFKSGDLDEAISIELENLSLEGDAKSPTNNPKAVEAAKIIRKHQEMVRTQANNAGADIKELAGYITTQTHDMFKVRKVDADQWVNDVYDLIDMDRTFGDDLSQEELMLALQEAYKTFSSGKQFKSEFDDPILAKIDYTKNIGGSMSKHRLLHFKDAKAWLQYNKKYGNGSLRENLVQTLGKRAQDTALMERMGPNAQETFKRVLERTGKNANEKSAQTLADKEKSLRKQFAVIDGSINIPANAMAAKYMQIVRSVQSMAKLGGAVLSAVSDIAIGASELQYQGQGFLDSYKATTVGAFNNIPKAHRRELAQMMGVFIDSQNASMTERLSGREDFSGKSSRALGVFFKISGLTPWTDRMRVNVALAMGARMGVAVKQPWRAVDPDLKRTLNLFNIGEEDWPNLKRGVETVEGSDFVTPEALDEMGLSDLGDRLRSYYIDRVDTAVIVPDARTMNIMRQGTQAGTVEGEFMRAITQFKAFPIAVMQKVLGREVYGRGEGGWKTGSGVMGIAHVIGMTTALGYVAMATKDIAKGREPRDPRDPKTWIAAMLQGGALGLYGDFILGDSSRYGQSPLQALSGPTLGTIEDAVEVLQALRDGNDPSAKALNILTSNTPFLNIFYTKAALDYLILYRLQEAMSEGYLRRMERRMKKENNQEFLIKPSSVIPRGGF